MNRREYLWNRYSTMAMFVVAALVYLVLAITWDRPVMRGAFLMGAVSMARLAWGERSLG
jgi:Na+/H+-translocating membrane pyrophosphatase